MIGRVRLAIRNRPRTPGFPGMTRNRDRRLPPAPGLPGRGHEHPPANHKENAGSRRGRNREHDCQGQRAAGGRHRRTSRAGKSTVAARIAARFGLLNLETGAMYRAFALKAIQTDSDLDDREELNRLAARTRIRLLPAPLGNRVFLDEVDVTKRIREADVTAAASRVSVHPAIREWLVSMQRQLGASSGIVMEGRDSAPRFFPTPR